MNVTDELDAFRKDTAGCEVVMLVDISTRMVLSSASATRLPQEDLDALATLAGDVLNGPLPDAALHRSETEDPEEAMNGVLTGPDETRIFLRAGAGRSEALVCLCSSQSDLESVFENGQAVLQTIMADA